MPNRPSIRKRMHAFHAEPKIGGMYVAALIQAPIDRYRGQAIADDGKTGVARIMTVQVLQVRGLLRRLRVLPGHDRCQEEAPTVGNLAERVPALPGGIETIEKRPLGCQGP